MSSHPPLLRSCCSARSRGCVSTFGSPQVRHWNSCFEFRDTRRHALPSSTPSSSETNVSRGQDEVDEIAPLRHSFSMVAGRDDNNRRGRSRSLPLSHPVILFPSLSLSVKLSPQFLTDSILDLAAATATVVLHTRYTPRSAARRPTVAKVDCS